MSPSRRPAQPNPRAIPVDHALVEQVANKLADDMATALESGKYDDRSLDGAVFAMATIDIPVAGKGPSSARKVFVRLGGRHFEYALRGEIRGEALVYEYKSGAVDRIIGIDVEVPDREGPEVARAFAKRARHPFIIRERLTQVLLHEVTHMSDPAIERSNKDIGTAASKMGGLTPKSYAAYVNQPTEINARIQEVTQVVRSDLMKIEAEEFKQRGYWPLPPVALVLYYWRHGSTNQWKMLEPYLTEANKRRILLAIDRELRDAGIDTSGHGVLPNPSAPSNKKWADKYRYLPADTLRDDPLRQFGELHKGRVGHYWTVPVDVPLDELSSLRAVVQNKSRLASIQEATVELPPIEVGVFRDGTSWLVDGNHRLVAARRAKARTIPVTFTFVGSEAAPTANPATDPPLTAAPSLAETERAARALGIDFTREKFSLSDLREGMRVEAEHADVSTDPVVHARIAKAHLDEFADYYRRLAKMEGRAKRGEPEPNPRPIPMKVEPGIGELVEGLYRDFVTYAAEVKTSERWRRLATAACTVTRPNGVETEVTIALLWGKAFESDRRRYVAHGSTHRDTNYVQVFVHPEHTTSDLLSGPIKAASIAPKRFKDELRTVLVHELTHELEPVFRRAKYNVMASDISEHTNDPQEVRALAQSMVDEILNDRDCVERTMRVHASLADYDRKQGRPGTFASRALNLCSETWRERFPYMTDATKRQVLLMVDRALRDAGIDTSGRGALPNPRPISVSEREVEDAHRLIMAALMSRQWPGYEDRSRSPQDQTPPIVSGGISYVIWPHPRGDHRKPFGDVVHGGHTHDNVVCISLRTEMAPFVRDPGVRDKLDKELRSALLHELTHVHDPGARRRPPANQDDPREIRARARQILYEIRSVPHHDDLHRRVALTPTWQYFASRMTEHGKRQILLIVDRGLRDEEAASPNPTDDNDGNDHHAYSRYQRHTKHLEARGGKESNMAEIVAVYSLCTDDCEGGHHVGEWKKCDRCGAQIHKRIIEIEHPEQGHMTVGSECVKDLMGWKWTTSHEQAWETQDVIDSYLDNVHMPCTVVTKGKRGILLSQAVSPELRFAWDRHRLSPERARAFAGVHNQLRFCAGNIQSPHGLSDRIIDAALDMGLPWDRMKGGAWCMWHRKHTGTEAPHWVAFNAHGKSEVTGGSAPTVAQAGKDAERSVREYWFPKYKGMDPQVILTLVYQIKREPLDEKHTEIRVIGDPDWSNAWNTYLGGPREPQPTENPALPTTVTKLYHGTSKEVGEAILASGYVEPGHTDIAKYGGKQHGAMTPLVGRVYVTTRPGYALWYARGGWLFEVDPSSADTDVMVDEDQLGKLAADGTVPALSRLAQAISGKTKVGRTGQTVWDRAREGLYADQVKLGKAIIRHGALVRDPFLAREVMSKATQFAIAHPLRITRAWRVDKDLKQSDDPGNYDFSNALDQPGLVEVSVQGHGNPGGADAVAAQAAVRALANDPPPTAEDIDGYRRNPDTWRGSQILRKGSETLNRIQSYAKKNNLPMPTQTLLGEGSFGYVYETEKPSVVFKLTDDPQEVEVVRKLLAMGKNAPAGIVRYFGMLDMMEWFEKDRPIYALWREDARDINVWYFSTPYEVHSLVDYFRSVCLAVFWVARTKRRPNDLGVFVNRAKRIATELGAPGQLRALTPAEIRRVGVDLERDDIPFWFRQPDGTEKLVAHLQHWEPTSHWIENSAYRYIAGWILAAQLADAMTKTEELKAIGEAILVMIREHGILLTDTRRHNIGRVKRGSKKLLVITDPGANTADVMKSSAGKQAQSSDSDEEESEQ